MSPQPYTVELCPVCRRQIEDGDDCFRHMDAYGLVAPVRVAVQVNELDATLSALRPRRQRQKTEHLERELDRSREALRRARLTPEERAAEDQARRADMSKVALMVEGYATEMAREMNRTPLLLGWRRTPANYTEAPA